MAPDEDPDEERPLGGQPLPPDDRLWRHPSELGPPTGGPGTIGPTGSGGMTHTLSAHRHRTSTRSIVTGACLAGALVALGVLMLTRPMPEDDLRRSPGAKTTRTAVSTIPTYAAPALAAAPIHRVGAGPLGPASTRPGRLEVQVSDDGGPATVVSIQVDGPSHRAGVEVGDRVVAVNGTPVADAAELTAALSLTSPAEVATLDVVRRDEPTTLLVILG